MNSNNPFEIAKDYNIKIVFRKYEKNIKGLLFTIDKKNTYIIINSIFSKYEKIVILSHELGHFFLHSRNFKNMQDYHNFFPHTNILEYEANKFASELLLLEGYEFTENLLLNLDYKTRKGLITFKFINYNKKFEKYKNYILEEV